jgi:hypothetical protein
LASKFEARDSDGLKVVNVVARKQVSGNFDRELADNTCQLNRSMQHWLIS